MESHAAAPQCSPRGSVSSSASAPVDAQYVQTQMQALYSQVRADAQGAQAQGSASAAATPRPERVDLPRIRQPSTFAGAMGFGVDDWIGEMTQQFAYYGVKFPDDAARVRYAVAFLAGPAMHWWEQVPDRASLASWAEFVTRLHARFRPVQAAMLARQKLGKLSQRAGQSVNQYTSSFQIVLTPILDMGDADQVHHYVNGLLASVAGKVWERHPLNLKEAIDYAVSVEAMGNYGRAALPSGGGYGNRGGYHGGAGSHHTSVPMELNNLSGSVGDPEERYEDLTPADPLSAILAKMESMEHRLNALGSSGGSSLGDGRRDHDRSRIPDLKPGDIARMQKEGLCFRCKRKGHMKNECPMRPKV